MPKKDNTASAVSGAVSGIMSDVLLGDPAGVGDVMGEVAGEFVEGFAIKTKADTISDNIYRMHDNYANSGDRAAYRAELQNVLDSLDTASASSSIGVENLPPELCGDMGKVLFYAFDDGSILAKSYDNQSRVVSDDNLKAQALVHILKDSANSTDHKRYTQVINYVQSQAERSGQSMGVNYYEMPGDSIISTKYSEIGTVEAELVDADKLEIAKAALDNAAHMNPIEYGTGLKPFNKEVRYGPPLPSQRKLVPEESYEEQRRKWMADQIAKGNVKEKPARKPKKADTTGRLFRATNTAPKPEMPSVALSGANKGKPARPPWFKPPKIR